MELPDPVFPVVLATVSVLVTILLSSLAVKIWRDKQSYARVPFVVGLLAATVVSLMVAGIILSPSPQHVRLLNYIRLAAVHIGSWAFFWFAFLYARHQSFSSSRCLRVVTGFSAVLVLLILTNPVHHLMWSVSETVVRTTPLVRPDFTIHIGVWVFWGYTYALLTSAILVFGEYGRQAGELAWNQISLLLIALTAAIALNFLSITDILPYHLDYTPGGLLIFCLAIYIAFYRHEMFSIQPIAHRHVLDAITDAVIVVDADHTITDTNSTARDWFENPTVGDSLESVFAPAEYEWLYIRLIQLDETANMGSGNESPTTHQFGEIEMEINGRERELKVRAIALTLFPGATQFTKMVLVFSDAEAIANSSADYPTQDC